MHSRAMTPVGDSGSQQQIGHDHPSSTGGGGGAAALLDDRVVRREDEDEDEATGVGAGGGAAEGNVNLGGVSAIPAFSLTASGSSMNLSISFSLFQFINRSS